MQDRDGLEQLALECCPAELYYELLDNIENTTTKELLEILEIYGKEEI